MARISLLLSLALVLTIGSVSAHPPSHKKTQKTLCPPTLAGLQTFPSLEISKLIEKKAQLAPNTIQFNALFAICKAYGDHLAAFKVAGVKNVFDLVHAKHDLMAKAMFAAQASVGVKGGLAVKLDKSYTAMAKCFVGLEEKIAEISAKYKFNADAKISKCDRVKIDKCLIKLKASINVFVKVVTQCSKKFSVQKQIGVPVIPGGGFIGAFVKNGLGFGGKFIGLGAHGQVEAGVGGKAGAGVGVGGKAGAGVGGKAGVGAGVGVGGKAGAGVGVGGKAGAGVGVGGKAGIGGKAGAGIKVGGKAGAGAGVGGKAGAGVGVKLGAADAGVKLGAHAGAKAGAHAGGKLGAKAGVHGGAKVGGKGEAKVGAHAGGKIGGLINQFLGFDGKVQYDAAGKAKIGGGAGFKSLSHHEKHLN
ncbi:keratin, type I cytoskeletal 9 [Eutrema salsugineum]|uniref:keratin, type I cytoskeletal 9 n=1 Tax=Eutrema salsugineum TaxID=72664 RepID=UPI000CED6C96|nr:keratin, type I cytoskeletal 9 [Eutrema salsugineum]